MAAFAIETEDLRKVYGDVVAVRGLTVSVGRGEVFGFLGQNGAGKSTSVKMLLDLVRPTAGRARLLGAPLGDRAVRSRIGFLPEHFRFHEWLTAEEFLTLHGRLQKVDRARLARRSAELLERVGLSSYRRKRLQTFSKGMLQRVGLAQALLHEPDLVFLDEPTSGLDPGGRLLVRDMIRDLRAAGTTVFLNSHLLGEVEATCDRVAFIRHGEVRRVGTLGSLAEGQMRLRLRLAGLDATLRSELARFGREVDVAEDDGAIVLAGVKDAEVPEIVRFLVSRGVAVREVVLGRPSLEDLFVSILGKDGGL